MKSVQHKEWVCQDCDEQQTDAISRQLEISPLLARLLVNRGVSSVEDVFRFLNPSLDDLLDPYALPDMDKAVARVKQAIERKEKTLVHGDYDVDGVTSAALLIRTLRALGAHIIARVPHRKKDGYDIKAVTVEEAKAAGASLILTADCGVTACETVSHAFESGIDVVITDHHEPGTELPNAAAVVNPRRRDSVYPFKDLAGVGVAFKFAQALVGAMGYPQSKFQRKFLDLVALGTVGDVSPLLGENRTLVKFGLEDMAVTKKVGLRSLVHRAGMDGRPLSTHTLGYVLAPRINAVGRLDDSAIALQLLLTREEAEADDLSRILEQRNAERQAEQARIWADVSRMLAERELDGLNAIVLAAPDWNAGVVGIVANKIVERYGRPAALISANEAKGVGTGSARSIQSFDIGGALEDLDDLLLRHGGHALAAGFSLRLDQLPVFEERLNLIAGERIKPEELVPRHEVDAEIPLDEISMDLVNDLKRLEPHGMGNPEPLFVTRGATVLEARAVGAEKTHLKMRVCAEGCPPTECIAFGLGGYSESVEVGSSIDLCYNIRLNEYGGAETVQLAVKDFGPASDA